MTLLRVAFLADALVTAWFIYALALSLKAQRQSGEISHEIQANQQVLLTIWISFNIVQFAGLLWPVQCAPVLVIQLLYKTIWLALIALPNWWRGRMDLVPFRLLFIFMLYCVTYPWVIPWRELGFE